jgi:hypothetical protein
LPALAVPAAASAIGNPDAELVRLGNFVERMLPSYQAALDNYNELARTACDLAWERGGFAKGASLTFEQSQLYTVLMDQAWHETGANAADKKLEEYSFESTLNRIVRTPAHTVAGLRAKAFAAIHTNDKLWKRTANDLDWDQEVIRSLVEAVCAVTGLPVPVEEIDEEEV